MKFKYLFLIFILLLLLTGCSKSSKISCNKNHIADSTNVTSESIDKSTKKNADFKIYTNEDELYAAGVTDIVYQKDENKKNVIGRIQGNYSQFKILNYDDAFCSLEQIKNFVGFDSLQDEFIIENKYIFKQQYKGIPVYGHCIRLTVDDNGVPIELISNYLPNINIKSVEPLISEQEAYRIISTLDVLDVWNDISLYIIEKDPENLEPSLVWGATVTVKSHLWNDPKYEIESQKMFCIDAYTGEFLREYPLGID